MGYITYSVDMSHSADFELLNLTSKPDMAMEQRFFLPYAAYFANTEILLRKIFEIISCKIKVKVYFCSQGLVHDSR